MQRRMFNIFTLCTLPLAVLLIINAVCAAVYNYDAVLRAGSLSAEIYSGNNRSALAFLAPNAPEWSFHIRRSAWWLGDSAPRGIIPDNRYGCSEFAPELRFDGLGIRYYRRSYGPTAWHCFSAPAWLLVLPFLVLSVWSCVRLYRQRRSMVPGTCLKCGYDLRESAERCPECGTAIAMGAKT